MSQVSTADMTASTTVGNAGLTVSPKMLNTVSTPTAPVAPVEATKPEETATTAIDPKVAEVMARREKAFYAKQREENARLKAERESFQREQESFKSELDKYKSWKSKIDQKQYLDVLQDSGVSYDDLTQQILNAPTAEQRKVLELEMKIAQLEGKHNEVLTAQQQREKESFEQAQKQITFDINQLVSSRAEEFETIKAFNAEEAVTELIVKTFHEEGRIMDNYEAAKEVEDYLFEKAQGIAAIKKLQPKVVETAPVVEAQKTSPTLQTQTLSNRMVPSGAKPMNSKERKERAIAAFMGQLK